MNAPEQNPFIAKDIFCPICLIPTRQARVKRHLYVEQALDIDRRTSGYIWKVKELEHIHPHLYFMWHCPHCRFTASSQIFEDPTSGQTLTLEQTRAHYVRATREDPGVERVLSLLSTGVTPGGPWDHQQAIRLHLLAIYVLNLVAKQTAAPDYLNLGRYSLRLAWLWRDLDRDPALGRAFSPTLQKVAQALAAFWPQLPADDATASRQAAGYYEELLNDAQYLERGGEPGEIHLLVARIHLQQRQLEPARRHWSLAWSLAQRHEITRKELESETYRLQEKIRAAAPALVPALRMKFEETSSAHLKADAAGRNLRNKSNQVRDLIDDLEA
jgi:hypothetical protein